MPGNPSVVTLAESALRARLRELTGDPLDRSGRVKDLADAVVPSFPRDALAQALEDVGEGDGGELRAPKDPTLAPRFHSARSSCALAVNAFGPWRTAPATLAVFGVSGFHTMRFERKCPVVGVPTRRPPNLDVLAEGASAVLAVESKLIEYVPPAKPASVEEAYGEAIGSLADPSWKAAVNRLRSKPTEFRHFSASQIVKHYLGLKSCFPEIPVKLVYLFWEPTDNERHPLFGLHRSEVAAFSDGLRDRYVTFEHATYADLFREWDSLTASTLVAHVRHLRDRYELAIFT